jgi:hypothetical protein
MSHDIYGYNEAGEIVAYLRFSMGNNNASTLYNVLDAYEYHAGVSGSGEITTFSIQQMEKALNAYKQICENSDLTLSKSEFLIWEQEQIKTFLFNCLETAQEEESVTVFFG